MSFTPQTITSRSVQQSLIEFSKTKKIAQELIDFDILSVETFISRPPSQEYTLIEDIHSVSKESLISSETSLLQKYSLQLKPFEEKNETIHLSLMSDESKTHITLKILEGSIIRSSKEFLDELKQEIWKKKLRAGLYIDIFEDNLDMMLQKLIHAIPSNKPLRKAIKLNVGSAVESIEPIDERLEKLYKEKYKDSHSIIEGVDKDELILKYFKAIQGKNGRACDGKCIKVNKPAALNLKPLHNESIREIEHDTRIEYFANVDGYVEHESGRYFIAKKLSLEEASFKSARAIETGVDKDISLDIRHKKTSDEDAVGSGVNINVKNMDVNGSVGSNVTINTNELNIGAQTHRNSILEAQSSANIKLHRGNLKANEAHIEILETGTVKAKKSIHIQKMLGGEAIAPEVKIEELLSNCTIRASKSIEIGVINGSNIKFIIDPDAVESYHQELLELNEQIKEAKKLLKVKLDNFNEALQKHIDSAERMNTFKKRVEKAQKEGKAPLKQDVIRIKLYKLTSQELKQRHNTLEDEQSSINAMQKELEKMYECDLHAKITAKSAYDGQSKVIFVNPKNQEELIYIPEGEIKTISLTLDTEGKRQIKLN